mgnify:CR=1 FL=1
MNNLCAGMMHNEFGLTFVPLPELTSQQEIIDITPVSSTVPSRSFVITNSQEIESYQEKLS